MAESNLGAGLPVSDEALAAYDRWVTALVTRYKDKVRDWEVWNEPNFGDNTINTPEMTADFNVRTAEIIKRIQPGARISGLALGHFNQRFVDRFFARLAERGKFGLFDTMTYHDYVYNPDANHHEVMLLRAALEKHTRTVRLRQGENGAPSAGGGGRGALWDYPWTELTQAKWDTRRMLGNLGQDIESSVFSLVEMNYTNGPINRLNYKGLLKSDASKRVIRPKIAYYAIQNVTSVFDHSLERLTDLEHTHNIASGGAAARSYTHSTDRKLAVFGYRHKATGKQVYTIWQRDNIPVDANDVSLQEITITNGRLRSARVGGHHHRRRLRDPRHPVEPGGHHLHVQGHPRVRRADPHRRQEPDSRGAVTGQPAGDDRQTSRWPRSVLSEVIGPPGLSFASPYGWKDRICLRGLSAEDGLAPSVRVPRDQDACGGSGM